MTGMDGMFSMTVIKALVVFFVLAAGIITVLWIAVPLAIFGIKGRIRELTEEVRRTNALLEGMERKSSRPVEKAEDPRDEGRFGDEPPQ
ncbi:MAG: hypothetical protein HY890_06110 [Deltaproteobacteria bacterium]|nr:hypothetical protein [Deltaproteobacteria bacterium]